MRPDDTAMSKELAVFIDIYVVDCCLFSAKISPESKLYSVRQKPLQLNCSMNLYISFIQVATFRNAISPVPMLNRTADTLFCHSGIENVWSAQNIYFFSLCFSIHFAYARSYLWGLSFFEQEVRSVTKFMINFLTIIVGSMAMEVKLQVGHILLQQALTLASDICTCGMDENTIMSEEIKT